MLATCLLLVSLAFIPEPEIIWLRGDANSDGVVSIADAVAINNWLFMGGPAPPCLNQADANDSGVVDVSDSTYILRWLYSGGSPPPYPGPYNGVCTSDPAPSPGCAVNPCP